MALAQGAEEPAVVEAGRLPLPQRLALLTFAGFPVLVFVFGAPFGPFISLPVVFFLKNKLHLSAHAMATYSAISSIPLYLGFLFGVARDRWSPWGWGDRGHLVLFGLATAAVYVGLAFLPPTYGMLLAGGLLATATSQFVNGAGNGLITGVGRRHGMTGQMSSVLGLAITIPSIAAYLLGGMLSGLLEGRGAGQAARILFLLGAGLMALIAAYGLFGPRRLFEDGQSEPETLTLWADLKRLSRHWPIYPALLVQLLWQFAPAAGAAMQYHLANDLHATDAQVGAWFSIFFGSFVPMFFLYGWLAQHVKLRSLLWVGGVLAVPQMTPLLFIKSVDGALGAALCLGVLGGIGQGAFTDLTMRSAPKGLEGTMMMLWWACYWLSLRGGDLWGADLYDHHGGFNTAVYATIGVYALILPALLLVPKRVADSSDV